MLKHNILKVAAVTPELEVGKPLVNVLEMKKVIKETKASLVLFPELSLTGYSCGDVFYQSELLKETKDALKELLNIKFKGIIVVGMPLDISGVLYNVAVVINEDKILGVVPKQYLADTETFNETRWFKSGTDLKLKEVRLLDQEVPFGQILFKDNKNDINFAVEIGEDLYATISPSNLMSISGANLILNLASGIKLLGESEKVANIVTEQSRKNVGAYVYASTSKSESTSEVLFSGQKVVSALGELIDEKEPKCSLTEQLIVDIDFGHINYKRRKSSLLKESLYKFELDYQTVNYNFVESKEFEFERELDKDPLIKKNTEKAFLEVRDIQVNALLKRLKHIGQPKVVLGLSGGLDSSLALLVLVDSFHHLKRDLKDIITISMPGLATSKRTKNNAEELALLAGVRFEEIDINEEVLLHFNMIKQDKNNQDITYENTQARVRTMTLMNIANKEGGIVIGTGSLSEIALGFMTYNADQMSMYAVSLGLPKTLVRRQFENYVLIYPRLKEVINDILGTPVSPELKDDQETEEVLGSYQINDYLLYRHLAAGDNEDKMVFMLMNAFNLNKEEATVYVKRLLNRFYNSQFKRQVMPDGVKVVEFGLSARSDYKMGSDVRKK